LHAKPQLVPSHVADAFAGAGHAVHRVPHVAGEVLSTQDEPHACVPLLQVKPHVPPVHVATAFVGRGQSTPHPPQLFGSEVALTHDEPQRVGVGAVHPVEHM
jgi:hypothetical protein